MAPVPKSCVLIGRQRGLAALEFAFVLPLLLVAFYGLVTFGLALYAQLAVSRAAEDAARAFPQLTSVRLLSAVPTAVLEQVKDQAIDSLAQSNLAPKNSSGSYVARRDWMQNHVRSSLVIDGAACDGSGGAGGGASTASVVRVRISFPYGQSLQSGLASLASWVPATLTGCATIQL